METLLSQLETAIPGWKLSHLIRLDPTSWQCAITDDEYTAIATGESLEDAFANAWAKALAGDFVGRLFDRELMDRGERITVTDLRSILNISRPTLTRRI